MTNNQLRESLRAQLGGADKRNRELSSAIKDAKKALKASKLADAKADMDAKTKAAQAARARWVDLSKDGEASSCI